MDGSSSLGQEKEQRKAKQAKDTDCADSKVDKLLPSAASGGSMWYRRRKMEPGSLDDESPGSPQEGPKTYSGGHRSFGKAQSRTMRSMICQPLS